MDPKRVYTAGRGRPRSGPRQLVADRGYDAGHIRRYLRRRRGRPPVFDKVLFAKQNVIERMTGWLKEHRRVATRSEKKALHVLAMIKLPFIRRYLKTCLSHTP